jgi:alpha-glucoside transport system substrate-binding protein
MPRRWSVLKTAAVLVAPVVLIAGCGSSDSKSSAADSTDLHGKTVTIYGTEIDQEGQGLQDSFKPLEERTGLTVKYTGDKSFEQQIGLRVDGGNPPDIAMFPQPGKVKDFKDDLKPVDSKVQDLTKQNFDAGWSDLAMVDGKQMAVPVKADLKSVVWYSPQAFKDGGYTIPTDFDAFLAMADKMIKDGKTPFCLGLGSDAATGWPATDWVEDWMLRLKGPDVYDKWVNHEIPFDNKDVVEVGQAVQNLWAKQGMIYGGEKAAASIPFQEAGLPLLQNKCMMYRLSNFYASSWPKGTTMGDTGQVNAFYLPGSEKYGKTTLSGGVYAAAFADRPEVKATMEYLASTEYSNTRAPVTGFLSPNKNTDATKYGTPIEQNFAKILSQANPVRYDGSDQMPGAVGSGTFWTAEVDITTGAKDVPTAYKAVEASWPKN